MNRYISVIVLLFSFCSYGGAQDMVGKANAFTHLLDSFQLAKATYPFDTGERYRFNYVPLDDRKGISVNELNATQRAALMDLLKTCLSEETVKKVNGIM